MLFLLAVVAVAVRHGRTAAPSVVSVGLFDFFFVQPLASFAVSDVQYLLTFGVLLAVGLLIGQLTAGLRLQAQVSVKREADARSLYEFARELSSALLPEQIVASAGLFVHATFGSRCALYIPGLDDRPAGLARRRRHAAAGIGAGAVGVRPWPARRRRHLHPVQQRAALPAAEGPMRTRGVLRWPRRAAACSPIPNRGVRSKPTPR